MPLFLETATLALQLYLTVVGCYLALLVVGAWRYRSPTKARARTRAASLPSIAILVPAHDEEEQIGRTVSELLRAEYPAERRRCFVIADNCTDGTGAAAAGAGAEVWNRIDPSRRGKAHALDWALGEHRETLADFDVLCFVDADMFVDPGFLRAIGEAFADPDVRVVQGRYSVANPSSSRFAALGFASYALINHVRPAGRCHWGGSANLQGSGMAFRTPLLLERGWSAKSLAEDLQLGKQLALEGIRVHYLPEAVVTSDIPGSLRQVRVQQSRWEAGRLATFRSMLLPSLKRVIRKRDFASLDTLLDLLVAPVSMIAGLAVLALFLIGDPLALRSAPVWLATAALATGLLLGLRQLRAPRCVYAALAAAPGFILWKLFVLVRISLGFSPTEWTRTPRS